MKSKIVLGLVIAIVFQFLILTGMYVKAALPLWTGIEVKLKTIPVDPRSMFRGNYARLRYDISELNSDLFPESEDLRMGEVVYIILKQGENTVYEFSSVSLDKPNEGIFIRGRIENRWNIIDEVNRFRIKYGIEAYFAPKEDAVELETSLVDGGVAVLMLSGDGDARIKDVVTE